MSAEPTEKPEEIATEEAMFNLAKIFDPARRLETDEDLLELAELVEDESA